MQIERLKQALEEAMVSPAHDDMLLKSIYQKLLKAYKNEEEYWKQRSRILWLSLGDKNSGYFHAITRGRKAINKFSILEDEEGIAVFKENKIAKVILRYYNKRFTS